MNTKVVKSLILLSVPSAAEPAVPDNALSYLIGGIIALLIMVYLIYTLLRPDKF